MNVSAVVLKTLIRRRLLARVVKDDKAFQATYDQLRDAYTRAFDERSRAALAAALERIRNLPAADFGAADETAIMAALERELGPEALQAVLRGPVLNLSEVLFRIGAREVGVAAGVDIAFGRPDLDTLDIVGRSNLYWIGNSWNTYVEGLFRGALQDYFREGMTRAQLTERFATDFAGLSDRGIVYYELLADHTATRTREMGRVTGYERAAVEYVQVRARLDERTTEICRHLHGRVIAVNRLSAQRAEYLAAAERKDTEAAKRAWTMHGDARAFATIPTDQLPAGTAGPPYHFRCRTITVMWVAPAEPARLEHGPEIGAAARREVEALTAEEHRNFVNDTRAQAEKLKYREEDFAQDVRKRSRVRLRKHAQSEFGLNTPEDYLAKARAIVAGAQRVFVEPYKDQGLQYSFWNRQEKGYVVVDRSGEIRGCFGHRKPGGMDQCLKNSLQKYQTEITSVAGSAS